MLINLAIYEIASSVGSPAAICGATPTVANLSGLSVTITDRFNNIIFNIADMSTNTHINIGTAFHGLFVNENNVPISTSTYYSSNKLFINIPLDYSFDTGYLKINISKTGYFSYNNTIKIYGYDITTLNSNLCNTLKITLIRETYTDENGFNAQMAYSDFFYIRKPFTNIIEVYDTTSSVGVIKYEELDLEYLKNVVLMENGNYTLTCNKTVGKYSCNKSYTIPSNISWTPEINHTVTCNQNCVPCISNIATNQIDVLILANEEQIIYIDSVKQSPYKDFGIRVEVYNYTGQLVYRNGNALNIGSNNTEDEKQWVDFNYSHILTYTDVTFSSGLNVVKVYLDILGKLQNVYNGEVEVFPNDTFLVANYLPNPVIYFYPGDYYRTISITTNTTINFGTYNSYKGIQSQSPTDLQLYTYYKQSAYDNTALYTTNVEDLIDEQLAQCVTSDYSDCVMYNTKENFVSDNNGDSYVLFEIAPVMTCEYTSEINICNWHTVTRTDCNVFRISNNSNTNAIVSIHKVIGEHEVELFNTFTIVELTSSDITLPDGAYILELLGFDNNTYTYVIHSYCTMFNCFKIYIDKLICDNATSNCSPCIDDNCNEKDYYNFNAFMSLYYTYLSGINELHQIEGVIDFMTNPIVEKLYKLSVIQNKAMNYCKPCNTPCDDCK